MINRLLKYLKGLPLDLRDAHAYAGIILMSVGFYLVYVPAALIIPGVILLWLAVRR